MPLLSYVSSPMTDKQGNRVAVYVPLEYSELLSKEWIWDSDADDAIGADGRRLQDILGCPVFKDTEKRCVYYDGVVHDKVAFITLDSKLQVS